jgi:hypothetical protein
MFALPVGRCADTGLGYSAESLRPGESPLLLLGRAIQIQWSGVPVGHPMVLIAILQSTTRHESAFHGLWGYT